MTLEANTVLRQSDRLRTRPDDDDQDAVVPVLRAGTLALEFCRRGAPAELAAVFARCIYLRSGDRLVCVGEPAIGNGPLTLIADLGGCRRFSDFGLRPGQAAHILDNSIAISDAVRFTLDRCEPWRPPRWPHPPSSARLADVRSVIVRLAQAEAPADGFGRLICPHQPGAGETPLARIARPRLARFAIWLRAARDAAASAAAAAAAASPVRDLIGLGPGLTPSGDDVLCGALAALDALAQRNAHAALARAIAAAPRGLTSPLSDCLLRAAASGHVGEPLCRAVSSVVAGAPDAAVAAIRKVGHSSGWDMMAGIATALAVVYLDNHSYR